MDEDRDPIEQPDDDSTPSPPDAIRVAQRALGMAAVAFRANLEQEYRNHPEAESLRLRNAMWVEDLALANELEAHEMVHLREEFGCMSPQLALNTLWSIEAVAVLAWSLNLYELPRYDVLVVPWELLSGVCFHDTAKALDLVANARLRPRTEIETLREQQFALHWRLREFSLRPKPMDFADFAKRASFGPLDISALSLVKGDLALEGQPLSTASKTLFSKNMSSAMERHRAANWLCDGGLYSEITTDT